MNEYEGVTEQHVFKCKLCARQFTVVTEAKACYDTHLNVDELDITNMATEPDGHPFLPTNPFPTILQVTSKKTSAKELYVLAKTMARTNVEHAETGGAMRLKKDRR